MSFEWDKRKGTLGKHKHLASDILAESTGEPPTGSASLSVDNGVDPPAEVTTLVAPGAAVDGDTATLVQTRLLGPFHVTFETPGLENPAEFGVVVGPVLLPGTVVVSAWFVVTETWVGDVDQMQVNIVSADGLGIAASPSLSASPYVISHPVGYAGDLFSFVFLNVSAQLAVSVWMSSGSLSGGEADIYALATTPV